MDLILYIYLTMVGLIVLFISVSYVIERFLPETHPIMKWWRKHIVGLDTEQRNPKDDIY